MSEADEVLERSRRMLKAAYAGLKQYRSSEDTEKVIGLYNAVTFGRSVTFVLQNLKGKSEGFEEWYGERVQVLKEDPVCSHMGAVRNKILKEGSPGASNYAKLNDFNTKQIREKTPRWADGVFIGDQWGGSGFYIERNDGTEEKFYFDFELDGVETGLYFEETQESDSEFIDKISVVEDDLESYIKILAELVKDAREEFGSENKNS